MATTQVSIITRATLLVLFCSLFAKKGLAIVPDLEPLNRSSFPKDFKFGAASSAYQYEGAANEGGRGPSIWDIFTRRFPEKIHDGSTGEHGNNFYHMYKEDVKMLKDIGLDSFRMSISWSRVLPHGKLSKGVNEEGIAFYNNVINELLANGITPFVTIFHWDLPQALEDEYTGFLSPLVVNDFKDFANLCFERFGDRVKHWITLNEPFTFCNGGYDGNFLGNQAPGRCSANCPQGDSAREPYIVAHHLLLCHAETVKLYREKYQATQKGEIGPTLVTHWFEPYSNSSYDAKAKKRALDFMYGWFIHPIVYGDYPQIMHSLVRERLPRFTKQQSAMLKGSLDFLGLNYYTGNYAAHMHPRNGNITSTTDNMANLTTHDINGKAIGDPTGVSIFYVYPEGLHDLLVYTMTNYSNPKIYITETGMGDVNEGTVENGIKDPQRIDFYNRHLHAVRQAMDKGVKVKGFIAWTYLDTFEWGSGYYYRFGLCYVDYKNSFKRILKQSARWFMESLKK